MDRTCVNLGCGDIYLKDWRNLDYLSNSPAVTRANLLARLPLDDNSADVVYSSHFIEHIPLDLVGGFLRECFRITKVGGRLRVVLPDWEELCGTYLALRQQGQHDRADFLMLEMIDQLVRNRPGGELGDYYSHLQSAQPRPSALIEFVKQRTGYDVIPARSPVPSVRWKQVLNSPKAIVGKLERIYIKALISLLPSAFRNQNVCIGEVGEKHAWMYDFHSVERLLLQAGFIEISRLSAASSHIPDFPVEALDLNPDGTPRKGIESIYIEAVKSLRAAIVNSSDIQGGAARAAYRIHQALRQQGVDSAMWVDNVRSDDWTVHGPRSKWQKGFNKLRPTLGGLLTKTLRTANPTLHSPAWWPSGWPRQLNASEADVVHLHWINSEMLSIRNIAQIKKPVIWTLHDMWAFCGAEHYTDDCRWQTGYTSRNRPAYEGGVDINRWTWRRKMDYWRDPMWIITPSRWLADCARQSVLMRNWPICVIPNAINTDVWKPLDRQLARQSFGLPLDEPLLMFGAVGGGQDPRKGFDLLQAALGHLRGQIPGLQLIIAGESLPKTPPNLGFPVHYVGHLHDDVSLCLLYSAVDVMVIPSMQENLPNTGLESHACATPVVAFNTGGLPDVVEHLKTGYLAPKLDCEDLARGIVWVLSDKQRLSALSTAARTRALKLWNYKTVAAQYVDVYEKAITANASR